MTPSTSSHRPARHLLLLPLLLLSLLSPVLAQECPHGGGLWGTAKDTVRTITDPVGDSLRSKYEGLSDKGRFVAGACAGFGASRLAVRSERCADFLCDASATQILMQSVLNL